MKVKNKGGIFTPPKKNNLLDYFHLLSCSSVIGGVGDKGSFGIRLSTGLLVKLLSMEFCPFASIRFITGGLTGIKPFGSCSIIG